MRLAILTALLVSFILTASAFVKSKADYVTRGLWCIHKYEASWRDPNAPYWGGLQMDMSFQHTYGYIKIHGTMIYFSRLWGTADHWPVWAQIQAGRNGYRARGWNPWPNTARTCGLL